MTEKILLVDDEQMVIDALRRSLLGENYEIFTARSGEEALEILEEREIDLVISDEVMAGMSGAELLAQIAHEYPEVVSILITAHPSVEIAVNAVNEAHVSGFLVKPWNDIELESTVHQALQRRKVLITNREQADSVLPVPQLKTESQKNGSDESEDASVSE